LRQFGQSQLAERVKAEHFTPSDEGAG
jgi:hypothetical protein